MRNVYDPIQFYGLLFSTLFLLICLAVSVLINIGQHYYNKALWRNYTSALEKAATHLHEKIQTEILCVRLKKCLAGYIHTGKNDQLNSIAERLIEEETRLLELQQQLKKEPL